MRTSQRQQQESRMGLFSSPQIYLVTGLPGLRNNCVIMGDATENGTERGYVIVLSVPQFSQGKLLRKCMQSTMHLTFLLYPAKDVHHQLPASHTQQQKLHHHKKNIICETPFPVSSAVCLTFGVNPSKRNRCYIIFPRHSKCMDGTQIENWITQKISGVTP